MGARDLGSRSPGALGPNQNQRRGGGVGGGGVRWHGFSTPTEGEQISDSSFSLIKATGEWGETEKQNVIAFSAIQRRSASAPRIIIRCSVYSRQKAQKNQKKQKNVRFSCSVVSSVLRGDEETRRCITLSTSDPPRSVRSDVPKRGAPSDAIFPSFRSSKHSSDSYLKAITSSHGKYVRRYMCSEELKGRGDDECDELDQRPTTTQVHWRAPRESHESCGCLGRIEDGSNHQTAANDSITEVCFLKGRILHTSN